MKAHYEPSETEVQHNIEHLTINMKAHYEPSETEVQKTEPCATCCPARWVVNECSHGVRMFVQYYATSSIHAVSLLRYPWSMLRETLRNTIRVDQTFVM